MFGFPIFETHLLPFMLVLSKFKGMTRAELYNWWFPSRGPPVPKTVDCHLRTSNVGVKTILVELREVPFSAPSLRRGSDSPSVARTGSLETS